MADLSTSFRIAARGASYFALAFCHIWSITLGFWVAVGAVGEACEYNCCGRTVNSVKNEGS